MSLFYYLNEDHSVTECSVEQWSDQYEKMARTDTKHVAEDIVNECLVSTVWLGANHNYFGGEPLLFETMVFQGAGSNDIYCERYSTWEQAVEGHEKTIQWVKELGEF